MEDRRKASRFIANTFGSVGRLVATVIPPVVESTGVEVSDPGPEFLRAPVEELTRAGDGGGGTNKSANGLVMVEVASGDDGVCPGELVDLEENLL